MEYRNMIKEMKIKSKATRKKKIHYFPTWKDENTRERNI